MPTPAFAAGDRVSVVVAGSAVVAGANIEALLANWLRLRSDNPVTEARFYLPCTDNTLTMAVRETAMAVLTFEHPGITYSVVTDAGAENMADHRIESRAATVIDAMEVPGALIGELLGDDDDDYTPYIILAWGQQDEPPDDLCDELLKAGMDLDITVLEIAANGLEELTLGDPEEEAAKPEAENSAEQETAEQEADEPNEALREAAQKNADLLTVKPAVVHKGEIIVHADEAQAEDISRELVRLLKKASEPLPLADFLALVITYFSAQESAAAALEMRPVKEPPLLAEARRQLKAILREADALPKSAAELDAMVEARKTDEPAQAATEPSEGAPVTKGRPRNKPGTVSVFVNPDGTIHGKAKQGPTPNGLLRTSLPREQVPDSILAS